MTGFEEWASNAGHWERPLSTQSRPRRAYETQISSLGIAIEVLTIEICRPLKPSWTVRDAQQTTRC
jgi:hypothetical protein